MKTQYMGYELIEKIQQEELTIDEILRSYFDRIEETEPLINSFTHLSKEEALKKAKQLDDNLKKKKTIGKLYGLPIAVKGCICIKNSPTTCASLILEGYRPPFNATDRK
ncbi:MAG: amidase family protein, partial [Promethearchaeota archaeon]